MTSKMGRAIVANSSMQLLLKQSSSAVDVLSDVFKLTDEEKETSRQLPSRSRFILCWPQPCPYSNHRFRNRRIANYHSSRRERQLIMSGEVALRNAETQRRHH